MNFVSRVIILLVLTCCFVLKSSFAFWRSENKPYIYLVGSSTVSPFMAAVSEEFSRSQNLKNSTITTPLVESTGTTEGFRLFCSGVGLKFPDFSNASRPIEPSEVANCHKHGVNEIVEIKIGYDGIVIGNSTLGKKINLTKEQIFLALAEKIYDKKSGQFIKNPYEKWSEIDPSLPNKAIVFYGPPPSSGTRDIFIEMVMENVCFTKKEFVEGYSEAKIRRQQCGKIRADGNYVESGENDYLTIESLKTNPDALGILGFNFLVPNRSAIQAATIDNIEPNFNSIASKKYPLSRPLFVYFKKEHLNLKPEMSAFIQEIISPETIGHEGYLKHNGLVTLSDFEAKKLRENILSQLK